jgi:hypothetical protein
MNIIVIHYFIIHALVFCHTHDFNKSVYFERPITIYNLRTLMWWSHFINACVQHTVINEYWKSAILSWSGVQWHTIHAKFCEMLKVSMGSRAVEVGWGSRRLGSRQHSDHTSFKEMTKNYKIF